jgi:hypothetical protein
MTTTATIPRLLSALDAPFEHPIIDKFVLGPLERLWQEIVAKAPTFGSAVALLLGLWIVARVVRAVTARLLKLSKLDRLTEDTWFGRILSGLGEGFTPSRAIAALLYLAIMTMALAGAADILGLSAVRNALAAVLSYVPRLVAALCILGVGGYVGRAARRAVGSVMKELKSPYAGMAESSVEALILILTVTVAVNALGADLSFVTNNLAMILGTLMVTAAFLFGWSMRRPAEEIIANYYLRRLVRVGDKIRVAEVEGTVERFAALGLLLRDEDGSEHFGPARHVLNGIHRAEASPLARNR